METLQGVFPLVPAEALVRVLDICDQNVEAASDWLLEHDWHEVMEDDQDDANENDDEDGQDDDIGHETTRGHPNGVSVMNGNRTGENGTTHRDHSHQSAATAAPPEQPGFTMAVSTESALWRAPGRLHAANGGTPSRTHHRHTISHRRGDDDANGDYDSAGDPDGDSEDAEDEEDEEDDDDDDDEDDDGDANSYYDSGDESYFQHSAPQLAKRVKVTRDANANVSSSEHFWSSFDGQVVPKTLIELLNTTLTKVAHSTVTLLNKSSKLITEDEARPLLTSILKRVEEGYSPPRSASDRDAKSSRSGNSLSRILNSSPPDSVPDDFHPGQKRKRSEDPCPNAVPTGFFAHFFPISDLDMVWRSILHAHLFSSRFGPVVEFHTASTGAFSRRDFDELMHIHTNVASSSRSAALGLSPLSNLKCCLLLPCDAREEEIYRVGKHLHTLLKLPGSLYYRTLTFENDQEDSSQELLNEDNKLTEESFRRFARYRIKKEEVESADKSDKDTVGGIDHFLSYQQQRKVNLCLQVLEKDAWVQRISD